MKRRNISHRQPDKEYQCDKQIILNAYTRTGLSVRNAAKSTTKKKEEKTEKQNKNEKKSKGKLTDESNENINKLK